MEDSRCSCLGSGLSVSVLRSIGLALGILLLPGITGQLDAQSPPGEICNDGVDNDGDGLVDLADSDCSVFDPDSHPIYAFMRGDPDNSKTPNLPDAIIVLRVLFLPETHPTVCEDACDANDSGLIDLADVIVILNCLFLDCDVANPVPPMLECDIDRTVDDLGCTGFACL